MDARVVRDQGATTRQTHACDQHTAHSTFFPGMAAPRSEHGRAREVYTATQPSGHLAGIGNDPKSSWRRWRALTETQPAGQLLIGPDPESSSPELAQAFEPGQAARSLQALSLARGRHIGRPRGVGASRPGGIVA